MNNFEERFILGLEGNEGNIIYDEHLLRYELALGQVVDKVVLDIASGSGYGSYILAKSLAKEVIGVDIDRETLALAQSKYKLDNLEYKQGSALNIPLENAKIDIVISFETIEHLKNEKEAGIFLQEIKRVLKDNGKLIISTPNKEVFKQKNPYHQKEYTKNEFSSLIKKYFKYQLFLEQYNSISSTIHNPEKEKNQANFFQFNKNEKIALYFVVVCSNEMISDNFFSKNFTSVNQEALMNLKNNPVLKLADKFYPYYRKIRKIF